MIRSALCGLLAVFLTWGGPACADARAQEQPEPPARLKKKAKPQQPPTAPDKKPEKLPEKKSEASPKPEAKKPEESGEDPEKDALELEQKMQEAKKRLSENFKLADDRLEKKDAGEGTQQVQRDIVHDLDELIDQTQRLQQQQEQQQSSSSSSSSSQRNQQARRRRMQRGRSSARRPMPTPEQESTNNQAMGNLRKYGQEQQDNMSKIADLYKDVWGHLPETLRQEMDQYSREQFMAKYNELLKQYYSTIAEKGRKTKE